MISLCAPLLTMRQYQAQMTDSSSYGAGFSLSARSVVETGKNGNGQTVIWLGFIKHGWPL
jgi:hypothetical protein